MSFIALQLTADDIRWESKLWQDRGLEKSVTKFLVPSRVTFRCLSCTTQVGQSSATFDAAHRLAGH